MRLKIRINSPVWTLQIFSALRPDLSSAQRMCSACQQRAVRMCRAHPPGRRKKIRPRLRRSAASGQAHATQGILHAVGDGVSNSAKDYCITYNSSWTTLPTSYTGAVYHKLQNLSSVWLCSESEVPTMGLKDKAVVVMVGNCSILDKAMIAQNRNAKMLLVASKDGLPPPKDNRSGYESLTIPIAYMKYGDILNMEQDVGRNIEVAMYSPSPPLFDYSMLVIFLISVFTVALGGYWSGVSELRFDVRFTSSSTYYISCTIGYAVGMILTLIILIVLTMGQPALLYLVPCTLLASSVVAWRRKEMKKFWNGGCYEIMEQTDNAVSEENIIRGDAQGAP
ncbi:hypothetical protein GDO78_005343 [Eleutherodactylus coqui]|uniref:PA domain-containing protein n=1 Tax=Eleutherodactylus coqui TaxID=57060 RepID=A0A8J6FJS4_ELECQ|nr:hypothetical protein GDO78_005343 [Eleutherodactylus coqui]